MLGIRRDLFWALPNMVMLVFISFILCYLTNKMSETYLPIDNLSKNYYDITIDQSESMECEELLNYFDSSFKSYRLQKYADKGYTPVYLKNYSLNIDLIEGREFNEDDFSNHNNVAIISDELFDRTYENDGKRYFSIDNESFEVIGLFKKKENSINKNSDVFISMLSTNYLRLGVSNGRYYLDNISEEELSRIHDPWFKTNETILNISFEKRLSLVKDTTIVSFKIICYIFIFFIFGLLFLFTLWISSHRVLIHICHICGGEKNKIIKQLYVHWLCISSIGCFFFILTSIIVLYSLKYIFDLLAVLVLFFIVDALIINRFVRNIIRKEI